MTVKPLLIIMNGLPASGKTTLAKRLAADLSLLLFSRDGIYKTLYDALDCNGHECPPTLGAASFAMLYSVASSLLTAGQSLMVEGFFGWPVLRSAEFLELKSANDLPLQMMCRVLLERFLARAGSDKRYGGHQDLEWLEQNKDRLLQGHLAPLSLDGPIVEIDTTHDGSFDYAELLKRIEAVRIARI